MFPLCKINTRPQATVMTSLRKAARGRRRPVNFVAKHILSKKESVQRGVRNVQSAVAEITSQQPAQLPDRKVYNLRDESSDDSDVEYITSIVAQPEMIHAVAQEHDYPKVIYTEMLVGKTEVKFQIDSSVSANDISADLVVNKKLEPTTKTLQMWNDTTLKPLGSCRLILHNPKNKKKFSVEFLGVDSHSLEQRQLNRWV